MSAMRDMSRAIRHELSEHGHITEIPDDVLYQYIEILHAFYADLKAEQERRQPTFHGGGQDLTPSEREVAYGFLNSSPEDVRLAGELGVKYATRCVCQHVVIFSDQPIDGPQILPCCENQGECPDCVPEGYEHALELHQ